MWTPFVYEKCNYLIKIRKGDFICVYLTDLINLWSQELKIEDLFTSFKSFNPLVELKSDEIYSNIENIIFNNEPTNLKQEEDFIRIEFKAKLEEQIPIKIAFVLKIQDVKRFSTELVVPLIKTIQYLECKQEEFCELLVKKDKEIREYELEYGLISRNSIITEKFESSLKNYTNENLLLKVFGKSKLFIKCFGEKFGDIKEFIPNIKTKRSKNTLLKPYVLSNKFRAIEKGGSNQIKQEVQREVKEEKEDSNLIRDVHVEVKEEPH